MLSRSVNRLVNNVGIARPLHRPTALVAFANQRRGLHVDAANQRGENPAPLNVRYWTGKSAVDPKSIQIDLSKYDMRKILSARDNVGDVAADLDLRDTQVLKEHIDEVFANKGAVHMVKTGLSSFTEFEAVNNIVSTSQPYEGGANMRFPQEKNVYDTGAPSDADLHYHHEMAYLNNSPEKLSFFSLEATPDPLKGATFISENYGATQELMETDFGQRLVEKGCCYVRKLPDQKYFMEQNLDPRIVYNFWQTSTGVSDPAEAEEIMKKKGLIVEWEESPLFGRYMITKFYVDTFEYDPFSDRNTMYASVADDYAWFDSWPGVMDLPHWERPLKLNFGDDSVMTREEKQLWVDAYDNNGVPLLWEKGDIGMICNWRWAHGRPTYHLKEGEKRELGVIIGKTFERVGQLEGKD